MSVKLIVADYCQTCPDFEPITIKKSYMGGHHDTTVMCVDSDKCERLVKHIKEVDDND